MGFQLGPAARPRHTASMPWHWILIVGIIVGGCLVGWLAAKGLFGTPRRTADEIEVDPRPVILSLQHLGELHTVKMNMKEVLHKSTEKEPEGWMRDVPGAAALSHWTTHNEALVVAQGSVEAGIDLSHLSAADVTATRLPDGSAGLRVHLPRPAIYPPNITITVENSQNGLLWKDENLVPKAQEEASRRFQAAAEKDHILEKARESAVQRLRDMENLLGRKNIEFYF